jgi:hypothetical protein
MSPDARTRLQRIEALFRQLAPQPSPEEAAHV